MCHCIKRVLSTLKILRHSDRFLPLNKHVYSDRFFVWLYFENMKPHDLSHNHFYCCCVFYFLHYSPRRISVSRQYVATM